MSEEINYPFPEDDDEKFYQDHDLEGNPIGPIYSFNEWLAEFARVSELRKKL